MLSGFHPMGRKRLSEKIVLNQKMLERQSIQSETIMP
jgi:hypothetical protein